MVTISSDWATLQPSRRSYRKNEPQYPCFREAPEAAVVQVKLAEFGFALRGFGSAPSSLPCGVPGTMCEDEPEGNTGSPLCWRPELREQRRWQRMGAYGTSVLVSQHKPQIADLSPLMGVKEEDVDRASTSGPEACVPLHLNASCLASLTLSDCHGVTQNGSGSSSVTSPALVLVETPNESVCGGTVFSTETNGVSSHVQKAWCPSTSTPTAPSAGTVCGGTVGAILTCPLEVVKTRLQSSTITLYISSVQLSTVNGAGVARMAAPGPLNFLKLILEKEGPRSLFRGLGPNLVGVAPSRTPTGPPQSRWTVRDDSSSAAAQCSVGHPIVLHQWAQDAAPQDAAPQDAAPQDAAHRMLPTGRCPQDAAHRTLPTGRCPTGRCPTGRCPTGRCPTGRCPTGCCPQDAAHRTLPTGRRWLDSSGPRSPRRWRACLAGVMVGLGAAQMGGCVRVAAVCLLARLSTTPTDRAIYFAAYSTAKERLNGLLVPDSAQVHMLSAGIAGFTAITATNPIWLIKTRLQLDARTPLGTSTAPYRDVWRVGLANTAARRHTGRQTSCTEVAADCNVASGRNRPVFLSSMFLLVLACAEVIRTRLREEGTRYRSFFTTLSTVCREEGCRALYRGLTTHLVRQIPNTAIMMSTYEMVVYLLHR
ncbi:hypothetical protein NFI96_014990 [Prochilodus magdalenae]|nr:hypothetical protein NFI96_014990 [Prochilodus magdalenae]